MLVARVRKEREETQEYKERRGTLVLRDQLAHKVYIREVVAERSEPW